MKKRKTAFESFACKFLIICTVVFVVGGIYVKSVESSYNRKIQKLNNDISNIRSEIDSLQMQKQELATFTRVSEVAVHSGYTYQSDSQATAGVE